MNLLSKLGGNLVAERIKNEVQKILDEKISSVVINSVFPKTAENDSSAKVDVQAHLNVEIADLKIYYTAHLGKDSDGIVSLPPKSYPLDLQTVVAIQKPAAMTQSREIQAEHINLNLSGSIHGFEFQQMMMGMGATIHSVDFQVAVAGELNGIWLQSPEQISAEGNPEIPEEGK